MPPPALHYQYMRVSPKILSNHWHPANMTMETSITCILPLTRVRWSKPCSVLAANDSFTMLSSGTVNLRRQQSPLCSNFSAFLTITDRSESWNKARDSYTQDFGTSLNIDQILRARNSFVSCLSCKLIDFPPYCVYNSLLRAIVLLGVNLRGLHLSLRMLNQSSRSLSAC